LRVAVQVQNIVRDPDENMRLYFLDLVEPAGCETKDGSEKAEGRKQKANLQTGAWAVKSRLYAT